MALEHARAFSSIPGVEIVGIYNRTRKRAEDLASRTDGAIVCSSIKELYEKTEPQLVVAAVSIASMLTVSRACMKYPWTCFLEKPPGSDLRESLSIQEEAMRRGRNIIVGLNRRFYSSTKTAERGLGGLDAPRYIHVLDRQNTQYALSLGHPRSVIKKWMYAASIHLIDYFRIFGRGKIVAVRPILPWNPSRPNVVLSELAFDSGDVGLYEAIWNGPGPWGVAVTTPEIRWEMRPLEKITRQNGDDRRAISLRMHQRDRDFKPGFRLQAEQAVAAALGKPSMSATLNDAVETMRLVQRLYFQAQAMTDK
jgi:predicted dehydrogenase